VTPREVDLLRARLGDIADTAAALAKSTEDLYRLAYEKGSAQADVKVAGGGIKPELDSHGDPRARHLWHKLEKHAKSSETALRALLLGIGNLMAQGQIDTTVRFGSAMTPAEFEWVLMRQRARQANGEYTPHRTEEQPDHPSRRKGKKR
jgi:hypothetical protein